MVSFEKLSSVACSLKSPPKVNCDYNLFSNNCAAVSSSPCPNRIK